MIKGLLNFIRQINTYIHRIQKITDYQIVILPLQILPNCYLKCLVINLKYVKPEGIFRIVNTYWIKVWLFMQQTFSENISLNN